MMHDDIFFFRLTMMSSSSPGAMGGPATDVCGLVNDGRPGPRRVPWHGHSPQLLGDCRDSGLGDFVSPKPSQFCCRIVRSAVLERQTVFHDGPKEL